MKERISHEQALKWMHDQNNDSGYIVAFWLLNYCSVTKSQIKKLTWGNYCIGPSFNYLALPDSKSALMLVPGIILFLEIHRAELRVALPCDNDESTLMFPSQNELRQLRLRAGLWGGAKKCDINAPFPTLRRYDLAFHCPRRSVDLSQIGSLVAAVQYTDSVFSSPITIPPWAYSWAQARKASLNPSSLK